jgi:hypothetical protein
MKKLLVVLLSLGLIVALGTTASAADVKFNGSYYVVGVYESNPVGTNDYSHAFFYQRFRLQPVFQIAEGLTFTARFDALEKQWGNTNWKGNSTVAGNSGPDDMTSSRRNQGLATTANTTTGAVTNTTGQKIQESIEFERAYVTFMTGIGAFQIGYQNVDDWGTDFGDYSNSRPRALFTTKLGPVTLAATYEKVYESDTANVVAPYLNVNNSDRDTYALSAIYNAAGIEGGFLYKYYAYNNSKPIGVKTSMTQLSPYVKATFGPVYLEGEATYWFGKMAEMEAPYALGRTDVDLRAWSAYLKARFNIGPAYVGALGAYSSGNDLTDDTKSTTAPSGGGTNFAPALILMNDALATWSNGNSTFASPGGLTSSPGVTTVNPVTSSKYNMVLGNVFAGFNVTPKFNVEAALTFAKVDKAALSKVLATGVITEAVSDKLGTEFDVKATYKIYDNLTYMIGAGYLWTGDYFKGADPNKTIDNDYMLINQLTLSF